MHGKARLILLLHLTQRCQAPHPLLGGESRLLQVGARGIPIAFHSKCKVSSKYSDAKLESGNRASDSYQNYHIDK